MKEKIFSTKMFKKLLPDSLILLFVAALFVLPVNAALSSVGPNDPVIGFPSYYVDSNGLALQPCLADATGLADKNCVLPLTTETFDGVTTFDPKLPIVFPTNFPSEAFYWVADAKSISMGPQGKAKLVFRMSLEGAFATLSNPPGRPVNGQQIMFLRINMKKTSGLVPNSLYTVTHPFGTYQFSTDSTGTTLLGLAGQAFRTQDTAVPLPFAFADLLPAPNTNLGPFLVANPLPACTPGTVCYIGNPLGLQAITNSPPPIGINYLKIDGPSICGTNCNSTIVNQWTLAGKIMKPGVAMSVDASAKTTSANIPANYILTITNTGNAADTFNLAVQGAAGATASLSAPSITLTAGASGTVILSVASASPGNYIVGVTASSSISPTAAISTTTTVGGINPTIAMLLPGEPLQFSDLQTGVTWSSSIPAVGDFLDPVNTPGIFTAGTTPGVTTVTATGTAATDTATVIVGSNATNISLVAGYNLIVAPVQPDPSFTANKLLQLIASQNPGVAGLKVARWNPATQAFEIFDSVAGITDFPIEANRPYFVKVSAGPAKVRIVGK